MKIVLIGYMGSGKSTIGEQLAKSLNYIFIDLDQAIENEEQQSISEIFSKKGEIYFRKLERKVLETILTSKSNIVLATGGGTPCFGDTMEYIDSVDDSTTIYLKTSNEVLTERLLNENQERPLIAHLDSKELLNDFIRKHLFERSFYYNKSAIKIQSDGISINELVQEIENRIFN